MTWPGGDWLDRAGVLLLAGALAAAALVGLLKPVWNWDTLPYVALVEANGQLPGAVRHQRAYALVHAAAPAEDWRVLTNGSDYRLTQWSDAAAFDSQLGMYRIKAGYLALARLLHAFAPAITSLRLVNVLALAVLGMALGWWMVAGGFGRAAFFLVPVLFLGDLLLLAQLVTPDLLCVALAAAAMALVRCGRWLPAAAFVGAATLVRPDFVLFPVALLAVALLTRRQVSGAALCCAAAVGAYGFAVVGSDHPGWWTHFSVSLIERANDLRVAPAPFSVAAYLEAVARALWTNALTRTWPALALLLAGSWLLVRDRASRRISEEDGLVLALILSLAARCAVLPIPDDRLYIPTVVMLAMLVAERISRRSLEQVGESPPGKPAA